jgi:hypothetical protein
MRDTDQTDRAEIRVAIAQMPPLLAAVVRTTVEMEQDMTIVAEVNSSDALARAVAQQVDVIVTAATSGELAPDFRDYFLGPEAIPIVAIALDGASSDLYRRSIARGHGVGGLSRLIRAAAGGLPARLGD